MAKNLPAAVISQIDAETQRPVLLVTLDLDAATLRFAACNTDITYNGNVYTAKAMEFSNIVQSIEKQIGRVTIRFDNVSKDMSAFVASQEFFGKTLTVRRIYLPDNLAPVTENYVELFNGFMEEPDTIDYHWLTVSATFGKPLQRQALLDIYQRKCNHLFGDSNCNNDSLSDREGTKLRVTDCSNINAFSGTSFVDSVSIAGAESGVSYWNYGTFQVVKSGNTYYREVINSGNSGVTLDVNLPFNLDTTLTSYTLWRGCSNTWNACSSTYSFGPSADNRLNFRGFIYIGDVAGGGGE